MKSNTLFKLFCALSIFIMLYGCSSFPECISEREKELTISWGETYSITGVTSGWSLDSKANLYTTNKKDFEELKQENIGCIPPDKYCSLLKLTKENILKTQALNAPGGDTSRFVEFSNDISNTHIRALWNARFQTVGSKGFRELYDSLMAMVAEYRK